MLICYKNIKINSISLTQYVIYFNICYTKKKIKVCIYEKDLQNIKRDRSHMKYIIIYNQIAVLLTVLNVI